MNILQPSRRFVCLPPAVLATLFLVACASTETVEQTPAPISEVAAAGESTTAPVEYDTRPFPKDTLYELLVAEFALQRKRFDVALMYYLKQSVLTRDPGIASHTWRLARYLGANRQALEVAQLWVEIEPENVDARFNLAGELSRADRPFEAMAQMKVVQEQGGRTNFMGIATVTLQRPKEDQSVMLSDITALLTRSENNPDLLLAQALLLKKAGQTEAALDSVRVLLADNGNHLQGLFLEARILHDQGKSAESFNRIDKILAERPDDNRLRLQYARMLANVDLARAEQQFEILVSHRPEEAELVLALAMVYRENERYSDMREQLERLLDLGQQQDPAHFYLALEAERVEAFTEAIEHYFKVGPSKMFPTAIGRGAALLAGAGQLDDARARIGSLKVQHPDFSARLTLLEADLLSKQSLLEEANNVLSTALAASPEEADLLYARSMVSEKQRDITGLERDLRELLRLDPKSPLALNALGYSLTNLTDRHQEALDLISRAHQLKPDDPAILDSMGWVHYRLGKPEMALNYLQRAIELLPDPEVAAHLGEVLWALGRRQEARQIWRLALEKSPQSQVVLNTVGRLVGETFDLTGDPASQSAP